MPVLTAKHCCVRLTKGVLADCTSSSSTALMEFEHFSKDGVSSSTRHLHHQRLPLCEQYVEGIVHAHLGSESIEALRAE